MSNPSLQYVTLRDLFALAWVVGQLSYSPPYDEDPIDPKAAYRFADEALEARELTK